MQPRLEIEFLRSDPSKIWVKACNEGFAGETEQYINDKLLQDLTEQLSGFPKSNLDEVVFEVGENGSPCGHCILKFFCFDSVGHTAVLVSVSNDNSCVAKFTLHFEALFLDIFISSLKSAIEIGKGKSELKGINAYTQNV
ncbi:MAG: hypothetical protein KKF22_11505 [Gammaproteobacteria bacterium]|nr:hypothetical protein [Gammaproteobacteria bacterium]